jgi:hypothetical protein
MSKWKKVGEFLKDNKEEGLALVGSLLTGNVPGAISAGAGMLAQATGRADPDDILDSLQTDPETLVRLKEIAANRQAEIHRHFEEQERLKLEDAQKEHAETQTTIRAGDGSDDAFVRYTRPGQSWVSLFFAMVYTVKAEAPDVYVLMAFLTLPFAYAGLRQFGKWKDSDSMLKAVIGARGKKT